LEPESQNGNPGCRDIPLILLEDHLVNSQEIKSQGLYRYLMEDDDAIGRLNAEAFSSNTRASSMTAKANCIRRSG
jgi:hypothetical protein